MEKIKQKLKSKKLWIAVALSAVTAFFIEMGWDVSILEFFKNE